MTHPAIHKIGRCLACITIFYGTPTHAVHAAAPAPAPVLGDWRVEDGTAIIRTVMCGKTLAGAISWEKEPGNDEHNPDPAKQPLPTMGLPILLGFTHASGDRWAGKIYNAENGKMYEGSVALTAPDTLHIKGCLLSGALCGGEDWTRVTAMPKGPSITNTAICKRALTR